MDNPVQNGNLSLAISALLGIVSWFTPANIDFTLKVMTFIGFAIGVFFAARYHWIAYRTSKVDKKIKEERLKRMKRG